VQKVTQKKLAVTWPLASMITVSALLAALYLVSLYNWALFHSLIEISFTVLAFCIFAVTWNSRRFVDNSYIVFMGISFLFVGILTIIHAVVAEGGAIFPVHGTEEQTIQTWTTVRYIQGLSFLIAPLFLHRKMRTNLVFLSYIIVVLFLLLSMFEWHIFPQYLNGEGTLSPWGIASQYAVITIFLGAIGMLLICREEFDKSVLKLLIASIAFTIVGSELILVIDAYEFGSWYLIRHFFTFISFFLVYKAFVETGLESPYKLLFRNLKKSEQAFAQQALELKKSNAELETQMAECNLAERKLADSEVRHRKLFETAEDGIMVIDAENWRITDTNSFLERMSGYSKQEVFGRDLWQLGLFKDTETVRMAFADAQNGGSPCCKELMLETRNGRAIPVDFVGNSFSIDGRKLIQCNIRDVSERKKAEKTKDEFIGMVSHELKTPLTIMIGDLYTLANERLPKKDRQQLLQDALISSESLAGIVENLLELSRYQANRTVLHQQTVDIGQIARDVKGKLQNRSAMHRLTVDLMPGLPLVFADPVRVERILYNLVENAIKYSPDGGEVKTSIRRENENLVVGVSDQGTGISPLDQPRLFQSFEQLGITNRSAMQGVGLGLKVCRTLVEAHNGRIWVESEPGKGSTFFFTLPLGEF